MSGFAQHLARSIEMISQDHAELFKKHGVIIEKMMADLHRWFDDFAGKKNGGNDYRGYNYIKHRQERHHVEGIARAVAIFTAKYGEQFRSIIAEQAQAHVQDDMGEVFFADDYRRIGFWKNFRGF